MADLSDTDELRGQTPPREARMAAMYRRGVTMKKIGEQYGLSRERVRQILKLDGLTGKDGGQSVHRKAAAAICAEQPRRAELRLRERVLAKWGISVDVWREHNQANGLLRAFGQQRDSAKKRGIQWCLTFAQWLDFWRASGKLDLRGRGTGKYVMARDGGRGPYAIGNISAQLYEENCRAARTNNPDSTRANGCGNLGRGRGWTFTRGGYQVMVGPKYIGRFLTQGEAEAAYRDACRNHRSIVYLSGGAH